ncbi:MAG: ArsR family transcriptional regulator [Candidatus Hodarchaeales archaeon]|jgi:DNA-binding HxlR family transcriptional regulator
MLADIIHPTRIKILKLLSVGLKTLSDLAKELSISKPEISRHLARLRDQGLIEKADKLHKITNLGETIINILAPLVFITEKYEFFKNHQIIDLPLSFVKDLDSLMNSELMSGTGYIFSKMEVISTLTNHEAKIMVDQPFPESSRNIVDKALLIVPAHAKPENIDLEAMRRHSKYFEIRTLPVVNYSFGVVDNMHGFIFFPGLNGKIDYNNAFYVRDSLGIEFLNKLWNHFWEDAQFRTSTKMSH